MPGEQHRAIADQPPDPVEAPHVAPQPRHAQELVEKHRLVENANHGAVPGRDIIKVVEAADAARARHVLHHECGIAGDVLAQVAGEQTSIGVVAA